MKITNMLLLWLAALVFGVLAQAVAAQPKAPVPVITPHAKTSTPAWPAEPSAPKGAPNVVLILLDDVGFAASEVFGGLISTPALSRLASQGLRYNNFHTAGVCAPTRASLLSGYNAHRVGFGDVPESANGYPGYNQLWKKSTAPMAEILRRYGYGTAAFGKWHNTPLWELTPIGPFDRWPTGLGFEQFYGFMQGETSPWEPQLYRNTTAVSAPASPAEGYHLDADIADQAIAWLRARESLAPGKPYFLYFSTAGTHAPHHVAEEWIGRYRGKFDRGWDALREEIFSRQKKSGVIPAAAQLTPRPQELPAWNSLSAEERKLAARQMEVYAAFLEHTDYQVGRLLAAVQAGPNAENTLIIYVVGDNGASGEGGLLGSDHNFANIGLSPPLKHQLPNIDVLGSPLFDNHFATAWSWMMATPFQWMKGVASHFGGTRNPVVVVWPKSIGDRGGLRQQFAHVSDVAPTIYEAVGIKPPAALDGVEQQPLDGISLVYSFGHPDAPSRHTVQYFEVGGNRAIYKAGWVAAARHRLPWRTGEAAEGQLTGLANSDYDQDRWELYHVDNDFSQALDLASSNSPKLEELKEVFNIEATRNDVYPLGATSLTEILEGGGYRRTLAPDVRGLVFYPDVPGIPVVAAPAFTRPHRISAIVDGSGPRTQGTILSYGSRYGGFALYVKNGRLFYGSNCAGRSYRYIESSRLLPAGTVKISFEFTPSSGEVPTPGPMTHGVGKLFIDGELVGESRVDEFLDQILVMGTLSVGRTGESPVMPAYETPFGFSGTIEKIMVTFL